MANPTRFPNGIALGYYNQFFAYGRDGFGGGTGTTAGLIAQGNTAPDVSLGSLFYTNNTGNTTITNFTNIQMGRAGALLASGQVDTTAPLQEGKLITIVFLDNSTQLASNSNLVLNGTNNLIGANNVITLMASNNRWLEMSRSYNQTTELTTYITNAQSSLNVNGVRVAFLNNTGGTTNSIIALSGGQIGQEVNFVLVGSNAVRLIGGGNIFMTVTNAVLVNASGFYKALKVDTANWRLLAVNSGGAF